MDPSKIAAEDLFSEMVRDWPPHVVGRLRRCLEEAGCVEPAETAKWVQESTAVGSNKNQAGGLASSTYSDRLKALDLRRLETAFNSGLVADARRLLAAHPPERGSLDCIADGHEREVTSTMERRLPARKKSKKAQRRLLKSRLRQTHIDLLDDPTPPPPVPLSQKRAHIVAATSSNKRYAFCLRFVFVVLTWVHRGHQITVPLGVQLESSLLRSPAEHLKFLGDLLRLLGRRPDAVILDRAYDSAPCRRVLKDLGLSAYVRLKTYGDKKRPCWDAKTGAKLDLNAELAKTADMDLPSTVRRMRDGDGRKILARQKTRTLDLRLERDGEPCTVTLVATYKVDFHGKTEFVRDHSFLLAAPLGVDAETALPIYAIRWNVEAWLGQAAKAKPANRAKGINAEVVQFFAFLYRVSLGIIAKFRLLLTGARRVRHRILTDLSAALLGQWVSGHKDPPPKDR